MAASAQPDGHRPTRTAIVEILGASAGGMTAAELAGVLGLHPNGVRKQLNALVRDGAVGAEREASGRRGRPAVRYRAAQEHRKTAAARRLASLRVRLPPAPPSERTAGDRIVDQRGAAKLIAACRDVRQETILRAALEAGLRRGEIAGLRWPDVHLEERRLIVRQAIWQSAPSAGRPGRVPGRPECSASSGLDFEPMEMRCQARRRSRRIERTLGARPGPDHGVPFPNRRRRGSGSFSQSNGGSYSVDRQGSLRCAARDAPSRGGPYRLSGCSRVHHSGAQVVLGASGASGRMAGLR